MTARRYTHCARCGQYFDGYPLGEIIVAAPGADEAVCPVCGSPDIIEADPELAVICTHCGNMRDEHTLYLVGVDKDTSDGIVTYSGEELLACPGQAEDLDVFEAMD